MPKLLEKPSAAEPALPHHRGEELANDCRRRLAAVEPKCLRTYTPSLAVIARSAGCYHWTPEGRMLADFTSRRLVEVDTAGNLVHEVRDLPWSVASIAIAPAF